MMSEPGEEHVEEKSLQDVKNTEEVQKTEEVQRPEEALKSEYHGDHPGSEVKTAKSPVVQEEALKYITIEVPQKDKDGHDIIARITVPVINEEKERHFRIVKRKRVVTKKIKEKGKEMEKEVEEEYDACMLVETVVQTYRLKQVMENGKVEVKDQKYVQEFFIGKERKYKLVPAERLREDGTKELVEEIEVETESEEEGKHRKRKRKKIIKNIYDSEHEFLGEGMEWEWQAEGEGRVREEFSLIEEEMLKSEEKEYIEEEIELEEEEWKAMEELLEEEEEEEEEEGGGEVEEKIEEEEMFLRRSFIEREKKRQKASFYKLMQMFLREIQRRKVLMKDIKIYCHLAGIKVESPGKEFDENPQKFIDQEAAECDALIKHIFKKYEEYKEQEEACKQQVEEARKSYNQQFEDYKSSLFDLVQQCNPDILAQVAKGVDLTKLLKEIFKYEDLLSATLAEKAITALNIEQMKFMLFTEVDQSHLPDEEKEMDIFVLDKIDKMIKSFEIQAMEEHDKVEKRKKNFIALMEDVTCKERQVQYLSAKNNKIQKEEEQLKKHFIEKKKEYLAQKKKAKRVRMAKDKEKKSNYMTRFPAIFHNQNDLNEELLSTDEYDRDQEVEKIFKIRSCQ